jgi:hypothetical protein
MGLGNRNSKEGDKGSGYSYELKHLQGLQQSLTLLAGLATEATLQLVLSAIQDGQDFEAKLVEDTNGVTFLEVRIWNPDTQTWEAPLYYIPGSNIPYNVGDPGGPVAPITYINNGAILSQIYAELLDQGITLDNIETNTNDVATETTLSSLLTAFNAEDFASETTLNSLLVAFNAEDFSTETTLASLLAAFNAEDFATETTLALANSNIQLGNITLNSLLTAFNAEDFATETTLELVRLQLVALNAVDFATETTLNAIKLQTDQMSFDGNSALEVVLPTGTNTSFYRRMLGAGLLVPAGAQKVAVMNIGNDNITVVTDSSPSTIIDPGIRLEWVAEEGKTLGAFTFTHGSPTSLYVVTQIR